MTVIDHKGLSFGNFQFPNGAETGNGHLPAALRGHYKKAAGIRRLFLPVRLRKSYFS